MGLGTKYRRKKYEDIIKKSKDKTSLEDRLKNLDKSKKNLEEKGKQSSSLYKRLEKLENKIKDKLEKIKDDPETSKDDKNKTVLENRLKLLDQQKKDLEKKGKQSSFMYKRTEILEGVLKKRLEETKNNPQTNENNNKARIEKLKGNLRGNLKKKINQSAIDVIKNKLPVQSTPELLKKETIANAQTIRAENETIFQEQKDEQITKLKDQVEQISTPVERTQTEIFVVSPINDSKFLASLEYQELKQTIVEDNQKASRENLKKSKESFTFPMTSPVKLELGEPGTVEPPKIPEIPKKNSF